MDKLLLIGLGVVLGLYVAKRGCGCKGAPAGGLMTTLPPAPTGGLDDGTSGAVSLGFGSGGVTNTPIDLGSHSGAAGCTGCGGYATAGGAGGAGSARIGATNAGGYS